MKKNHISSGINYLDRVIGGFLVGDNVIWQVESGAFIELFYLNFIKASIRNKKKVVFLSFNNSPKTILKKLGSFSKKKNLTLIDCFTSGKGESSDLFINFYEKKEYKKYGCKVIHISEPSKISKFIGYINKIEESYPKGTRYIFDSITGIQDLWGSEQQVLKLFTHQCPRLYELKTIAYWILEKGAHGDGFRANLNHISQVVIDLSVEKGICSLTVTKADNRYSSEIMKPQQYEVVNSEIQFLPPPKDALDIGKKIKRLREKSAISQSELAKKMGVSPSTISQVESSSISFSLTSLIRLAKVLDIPVGAFFEEETKTTKEFIFRKESRRSVSLGGASRKKIRGEELLPSHLTGGDQMYMINILPGVTIDRHFLLQKGEEIGYLIAGYLVVKIGDREYKIRGGDTIFLKSDIPTTWENRTDEAARLIWIVRS